MPDRLFANTGPEGRNRDSRRFEQQLRGLTGALGWTVLEVSVDAYLADDMTDAGGVDLVLAYRDPQRTDRNHGWLMEAKRHDGPGRYTAQQLSVEVQRLRLKVASLDGKKRFMEHERVAPHIDHLLGGILVHYCLRDYDARKASKALDGMELTKHALGPEPPRIAYLGPDSLNGLAEAFGITGPAEKFLWPVGLDHDSVWSTVCPPAQLAAGMIAYRVGDQNVLWLRDTLEHADIPALQRVARIWGVQFDAVLVTELAQEKLALLRAHWEESARDSRADHGKGSLPDEIRALELRNANMKEFNKRWPVAA